MSATASEQDSTLARLLRSLLTMVGGLKDEQERARLLATGLPSLLPCAVSGLALLNEDDGGEMVRLLFKDGERLAASDTEAVFDELAPLIEEAGQGPGLWRDEAENGSADGGIPPSLKKLGVRAMALAPDDRVRVKIVDTRVRFRRLSTDDIQSYLASREWRGKAGGYAIQGLAGCFVQKIVGSYTNVVGLPLTEVVGLLLGESFPIHFAWLRAGDTDPE